MKNKIKMKQATIAYMEKPETWALPIAIFEDEALYDICSPIIDKWIKEQNPAYILTENCGSNITVKELKRAE